MRTCRQSLYAGAGALALVTGSVATPVSAEGDRDVLEQQVRELQEQLESEREQIDRQEERLRRLERQLRLLSASGQGGTLSQGELGGARGAGTSRGAEVAQAEEGAEPVGEAPQDTGVQERPSDITTLRDVGGVLTPAGTFVLEPQIEYAFNSSRRFFFSGVEIVDAVLIGAIEAQDADRNTLTPAMGARYGITDRLEVDVKVPYVFRWDTERDPTGAAPDRDVEGDGIGDIEVGVHYQFNDGRDGWPFFVGNLRVKSDTGEGPFEVPYDNTGQAEDLATGSGFWSVEPSITTIFPSDPVVFFANLGYQWNIAEDVDTNIPSVGRIGNVDPGDSIQTSFGMGLGLNENASMNLGYQHDVVLKTETEINGRTTESDISQQGSFLLGFAYRWNERTSTLLNFAIGATEDAPDARVTFTMPIQF